MATLPSEQGTQDMNIFGVGGAELVLIFIIMLIVAGPKRMIRWAYVLGQYVGKLRRMWEEVVDMMQKEADSAGLGITIPKELPTKQGITKLVADAVKPYANELSQPLQDVQSSLRDTVSEANAVVKDTDKQTTSDLGAWSVPQEEAFGTWGQQTSQESEHEAEDGTKRS
jgi:Sec-independent protein translocase protein TatA